MFFVENLWGWIHLAEIDYQSYHKQVFISIINYWLSKSDKHSCKSVLNGLDSRTVSRKTATAKQILMLSRNDLSVYKSYANVPCDKDTPLKNTNITNIMD